MIVYNFSECHLKRDLWKWHQKLQLLKNYLKQKRRRSIKRFLHFYSYLQFCCCCKLCMCRPNHILVLLFFKYVILQFSRHRALQLYKFEVNILTEIFCFLMWLCIKTLGRIWAEPWSDRSSESLNVCSVTLSQKCWFVISHVGLLICWLLHAMKSQGDNVGSGYLH